MILQRSDDGGFDPVARRAAIGHGLDPALQRAQDVRGRRGAHPPDRLALGAATARPRCASTRARPPCGERSATVGKARGHQRMQRGGRAQRQHERQRPGQNRSISRAASGPTSA